MRYRANTAYMEAVKMQCENGYTKPGVKGILCRKAKEPKENDNPSLWPVGAVKPQRVAETASEDCWTAVVVRPNSRKINLVRFGAGSDYEISY